MVTILGWILLMALVTLLAGFLWLGISLLVGIGVGLKRGDLGHRPHVGDERCDH